MSYNKSKTVPPRAVHGKTHHTLRHGSNNGLLRTAIASFAIGVIVCAALLAVFAALLANTSISLSFVRPFACTSAALGVTLSSSWFSYKIGKKLLLCGLACGSFYALCQLCAAFMLYGADFLHNGSLLLTTVLMMGGLLGGALAAVRTVH